MNPRDPRCSGRLQDLARELAADYQSAGGINRAGDAELPSFARVEAVLQDLLTIVFPGYFGGRLGARACLETFVAAKIDAVYDALADILGGTLAFCAREGVHTPQPLPLAGADAPTAAERLALAYLEGLPGIRGLVRTDVEAALLGDPAATGRDEVILCYPGLLAIAVHRLAHPLHAAGVPIVPRLMSEWAHARTGVDIHPGAQIGPHFFVDHGTGVVVGETARIGARVKLYQGVTLGALSFKRAPDGSLARGGRRHPTIEDDVTIYANATILGGETVVGRGAVVGGGCWVVESVPAGGRILTHTHADR
ncbi:MAG: serine acetyltransferase [bacterium]|nr:serine acetyltransferase [bacterium]